MSSYPVFKQVDLSEPKHWVAYWKKHYRYPLEHLYDNNLPAGGDTDRVLLLFEWKNGKRVNARVETSIHDNFLAEAVDEIPATVNDLDLQSYLARSGGAIFRIFWLHINYPQVFPIFDMHAYRAMVFLMGRTAGNLPPELPSANGRKVTLYLNNYVPFVFGLQSQGNSLRDIDKALWTFGKFLSQWGHMIT